MARKAEPFRQFYERISADLDVEATGTTWLGSEIADENRIVEFAQYYLDHRDWPEVVKDELAQVVWESVERAWLDRTPTNLELDAAGAVIRDAQANEGFCWYLASIVLFGDIKPAPWPERAWLLDLPGVDLPSVLTLAANRLRSLMRGR